ncbi:MAG: hypothetical protein IT159_10410 [Bryobacterales bacterium]|nr:hypothetical protein [Bryobacterales bacterium]
MERSKADSFTAYLEEKQRREKAKPVEKGTGGSALALVAAFVEAPDRSMPLSDLQAASGMTFGDFADAVKQLQASGYLTVSGGPGSETAELTPLGEDVAKLARPE